ncbi:winged helix-turn-helix domain-containing protein [Lacrimispora sp.]|uniref:winged helix-turn-helix domain-containing protein n=1 Tax=Lacrimispora sp. TaxID=2719234 RepID=UPI0028B1EEC2|nr:winged helix-turn-helix domain-containing protein [Lacrimispora sp.]
MKKNASFIMMDPSLVRALYDTLGMLQSNSEYSNELLQGLKDLMEGEVATLVLGLNDTDKGLVQVPNDVISAGALEIYPRSRKVLCNGTEVSLTPKEFDILYFLAMSKGEVFTKEQIYQAVWAEDYLMADSNIMAFIRKLRKKIEPNPDAPEYILTIWGIGYKFTDKI